MGTFQAGIPHPGAIPNGYHIVTIDIKDCFFSIPIAEQDKAYFAFTVWEPNFQLPAKRFQWTVLPQGMKNSPAICQRYVSHATSTLKDQCLIIHYMDDILLAHKNAAILNACLSETVRNLQFLGFSIATEKVQHFPPFQFLGYQISSHISPMGPNLKVKHKYSLNELQQLCGQINWLKPFLPLTPAELRPLYDLMTKGNSPSSKITLILAAKSTI